MLNLDNNLLYGNKLQIISFIKKIVDRIIKIGLNKKDFQLKVYMEKELGANLMKEKCINEMIQNFCYIFIYSFFTF